MRELLFLSHRIPYPPDKGDKIRAWNIFRYLARTHRIHLGCFIDDPMDRQHLATLAAHCADLACLRLDPRTQRPLALIEASTCTGCEICAQICPRDAILFREQVLEHAGSR